MIQPNIKTERLLLRPFQEKDSPALVKICNDPLIAKNTINIPFPYTKEDARLFLKRIEEAGAMGKIAGFGITLLDSRELIGTVGLNFESAHDRAMLGYYLGADWRGKGLATEAVTAVLKFGFEYCKVNRIFAYVFTFNPASARVLEKAGFAREGLLHNHSKKDGIYEDEWIYGIVNPTPEKNK